MNSGKAILIGMSLVAGAILINYASAGSSVAGSGKFVLSSSGGVAFRMNTETAEISHCVGYPETVECTKWVK